MVRGVLAVHVIPNFQYITALTRTVIYSILYYIHEFGLLDRKEKKSFKEIKQINI